MVGTQLFCFCWDWDDIQWCHFFSLCKPEEYCWSLAWQLFTIQQAWQWCPQAFFLAGFLEIQHILLGQWCGLSQSRFDIQSLRLWIMAICVFFGLISCTGLCCESKNIQQCWSWAVLLLKFWIESDDILLWFVRGSQLQSVPPLSLIKEQCTMPYG